VYLTLEEKQQLVENPKFTLLEHIVDPETDTHSMIFSSEDRVIVAFRGSVSMTNWHTDSNSAEVVFHYVKDIRPDLTDIPHGSLTRAEKVTGRPPYVHGGFVKAYESVRAQITQIVEGLSRDSDNRVIYITGHSLGG